MSSSASDAVVAEKAGTGIDWPTRLALPFFLITLVVTFAGMALFGASQAGGLPVAIPYEVAFLAQFAPSGTAVYLAWRRGGGVAAKELLGRLVQWRVSRAWYAVALCTAPALAALVLVGNHLFGAEAVAWAEIGTLPDILGSALAERAQSSEGAIQWIAAVANGGPAWLTVLIFGIFAITAGGISEELGWRGHALSTLQANYSSLTASLVIALYWALWHIAPPPVWEMLFSQGMGAFLPAAGARLVQYLVLGIPLCILYTMIVNRCGGSVLLAVLFHATYNTTTLTLFTLGGQPYFWEMILGFWIVGGAVVAANQTHFFSRGPDGCPV
jgi:membrane protease YdiL (CAAX protease family)